MLFEKIHERHKDLLELIYDTPMPVLHQFELSCVVDEVHATSAIEGIHSTHRELKDILDGKTDSQHFSSIIQKYNMLRSGEILFFQTCQDIRDFYDTFTHEDIISQNPSHRHDGKIFR